MNDSERVYALYVQANPVPEPDLLPLTPAEAELLAFERSTDMDIRERIEVQPAPKLVPRRRSLAFGLAAILVVGVVAVGAFLIAGDDDGPVAAADAAPRVVFDGTTCRYEGPTLIEQGTVLFTAANTSTEAFQLAGFRIPAAILARELEEVPLGTDMALAPNYVRPAANPFAMMDLRPASERTSPWAMWAGTHVVECLTPASDTPDHVWRADTLVEVVAP